jgi:hypothetical protein
MRQDVGRSLSVREVLLEKRILEVIERQPTVSTRRLASRTCISVPSVRCELQEDQLHIYHIESMQELVPHDASARYAFCKLIFQRSAKDPSFTEKRSFTSELCFTRTGITNIHNEHVLSDENSYAIRSCH